MCLWYLAAAHWLAWWVVPSASSSILHCSTPVLILATHPQLEPSWGTRRLSFMDERKAIEDRYIPWETSSFLPGMCGWEAVDGRMAQTMCISNSYLTPYLYLQCVEGWMEMIRWNHDIPEYSSVLLEVNPPNPQHTPASPWRIHHYSGWACRLITLNY